jgi:hypothetical protein
VKKSAFEQARTLHWYRTSASTAWLLLGMSALLGCAERSLGESDSEPQVALTTQASTRLGIERTVPTRFVRLQASDGTSPSVSDDAIRESLEVANNIYSRASVQFELAGTTRVNVPKAMVTDKDALLTRSDVLPLTNALGILSSWCGNCTKTSGGWTDAITTEFFGSDELIVWVVEWGGGAAYYPHLNASMFVAASMLGRGDINKLAHEIGHSLGLTHSFEDISCQWWDQVYYAAASGSNKLFLSRAQCDDYMASSADSSIYLRPKDARNGGTEWCMFWDTTYMPAGAYEQQKAPDGTVTNFGVALAAKRKFTSMQDCTEFFTVHEDTPTAGSKRYWDYHHAAGNVASRTVNANTGIVTLKLPCRGCATPESYISGDVFVQGIARKLGTALVPAFNVMTYFSALPSGEGYFISDSQVETVLKTIRINAESASNTGQRTRIGTKVSTDPLQLIDLDGDGRRDIVTWNSPNSTCTTSNCPRGTFRTLLSSKSYSAVSSDLHTRSFGIDGDIVVLDDYDRDGKTDLGVFRAGPLREMTGGSTSPTSAHWLYCSSRLNYDCSRPVVKRAGNIGDIPIPGQHFSSDTSTGEIAIFRPSVGQWWWSSICKPATSAVTDCGGSMNGPIVLGSENSILMPDLWDGDSLTDIAVYDRTTATLRIRRSEMGYDGEVTRAIGSEYIPGVSGTTAARAGVNVIPQYQPYGSSQVRRRTFGMYDYGTSKWVSKWAWWSTSTTLQSCATSPLTLVDTPIGGLDLNGDLVTDRVIFSPTDKHSISFNVAGTSSCGSTSMTVKNLPIDYDLSRIVSAIADVSGDGNADIFMLEPMANTISLLTANTSVISVYKKVKFGDQETQFF